jgi:hypothetical protein
MREKHQANAVTCMAEANSLVSPQEYLLREPITNTHNKLQKEKEEHISNSFCR